MCGRQTLLYLRNCSMMLYFSMISVEGLAIASKLSVILAGKDVTFKLSFTVREHILPLVPLLLLPDTRPPLLQQAVRGDRWVKTHTRRREDLPGRVESFHRLLLVAPARGVFILAGPAAAGHGALHVAGDDVPQGFSHLGVFCCGHPCTCCSWHKHRESQWKDRNAFLYTKLQIITFLWTYFYI